MGSIQIIKHRNSQSYRIGKPGEDFTLTEVFHVTWIPSSSVDAYPGDGSILASASNTAITGTRVPKVQERYAGCDANLSFLVCESVDWRVNPEAMYSWTVTAHWATRMEFAYQDLPEPWTRITRVGQLRQMQVWRRGTDIPDFGTYVWPPTADIGGTKVDIHGQPSIRQVPQMSIICEFRYDRTWTLGPDDEIQAEPSPLFANWLGTRNTEEFLGYDPGFVLCTGISASPINDQGYLMQYRFLFDWLGHYEQRSAPATNGANFLAAAATNFIGVPFLQASKIGWYQPFPDEEDLKLMFPPDVYAALLTALPEANTCLTPARDLSGQQHDYTQFPAS
jgi:hypothetical protein